MSKKIEQGLRAKLRFKMPKGRFSIEDLYMLDLSRLDQLARELNRELEGDKGPTFIKVLTTIPVPEKHTQLKFDIVLEIIAYKQSKNEVAPALEEGPDIEEIL